MRANKRVSFLFLPTDPKDATADCDTDNDFQKCIFRTPQAYSWYQSRSAC